MHLHLHPSDTAAPGVCERLRIHGARQARHSLTAQPRGPSLSRRRPRGEGRELHTGTAGATSVMESPKSTTRGQRRSRPRASPSAMAAAGHPGTGRDGESPAAHRDRDRDRARAQPLSIFIAPF